MEDEERLIQLVKLVTYNNAESDILAQVWRFIVKYTSLLYSQWYPGNFQDSCHPHSSSPFTYTVSLFRRMINNLMHGAPASVSNTWRKKYHKNHCGPPFTYIQGLFFVFFPIWSHYFLDNIWPCRFLSTLSFEKQTNPYSFQLSTQRFYSCSLFVHYLIT